MGNVKGPRNGKWRGVTESDTVRETHSQRQGKALDTHTYTKKEIHAHTEKARQRKKGKERKRERETQ